MFLAWAFCSVDTTPESVLFHLPKVRFAEAALAHFNSFPVLVVRISRPNPFPMFCARCLCGGVLCHTPDTLRHTPDTFLAISVV